MENRKAAALARAAKLGSAAKTLRGAIRAIRVDADYGRSVFAARHYRPTRQAPRIFISPESREYLPPREAWREQSRQLRLDTLAASALAPEVIRRLVLSRSADRQARVLGLWSYEDASRLSDWITDQIGAASADRAQWCRLADHLGYVEGRPTAATRALSLSRETAEALGAHVVRRGLEHTVESTIAPRGIGYHHADGYTTWRNGKPKRYTRAENKTTVLACAVPAVDGLRVAIATKTSLADLQLKTLPARRGYYWDSDANGVRLVRRADGADYHPSLEDVRAGLDWIIDSLRKLAAKRAETTRAAKREQALIKRAAKLGVYVCFADSLTAGNCHAGTEQYAHRHGLSIWRHYPASQLISDSPQEQRRIALAVLAAQRRQARELAAGVCAVNF